MQKLHIDVADLLPGMTGPAPRPLPLSCRQLGTSVTQEENRNIGTSTGLSRPKRPVFTHVCVCKC